MTQTRQYRARPTPQQLAVRRGIGIAVLLALLAFFGWLALSLARGGDDTAAPPTTTAAVAPPPKPLRIVFPEGFTRRDMAKRVSAER